MCSELVAGVPGWFPQAFSLHTYQSGVAYGVMSGLSYYFVNTPQNKKCRQLLLDYGREKCWVDIDNIMMISGARNYAEIQSNNHERSGIVRTTLSSLLADYPNDLVRVHRSYLINPRFVLRIKKGLNNKPYVLLNNHLEVPVTNAHLPKLSALIEASNKQLLGHKSMQSKRD